MSAIASLAVVVVNYEGRQLLMECLASLEAALAGLEGGSELMVVDNGSSDGSLEATRERFPEARTIELGANRGFAAAANEGVRATCAPWILILNNDVTVGRGAPAALLAAVEGEADVGSAAAQLRFARGSRQVNSAGIEVDRLGVAYDRLLGSTPGTSGEAAEEVFGASAAAALYRREVFERLGGFDESFFLFLEDVDLAWRARMAGWRSLYVSRALVLHHHSAVARHGSPLKHELVGRNRVRVLAKNASTAQLLRYGPLIVLYELAYVTVAVAGDRTLAPLRGRLRGLREWRAYRRAGAELRRPVELAPVAGPRAALRRRRAWRSGSAVFQ